jgi:thioredoxin reductase (NADPH)
MYDLVIVGAGPAGIALSVEARAAGLDPGRTLVLEKSASHNRTIRELYPEHKLTTANYKGFAVPCVGLVRIGDMSKTATIAYFDRVIAEHGVAVHYNAEVYRVRRLAGSNGARFRIESSTGSYDTCVLAIAIGIFGRPKKPAEYRLPTLKDRVLFDISSVQMSGEEVLVVGGGDSAAEYVEDLHRAGNRVTLSYRGPAFNRPTARNRELVEALSASGQIEVRLESNIVRVDVEDGRPLATFNESPDRPRRFDRIVYALGGTTPTSFLRMLGIAFDERGPIIGEGGETDVSGLFLVGDLVVGRAGGSINTACNSAVDTMRRIVAAQLVPLGNGVSTQELVA